MLNLSLARPETAGLYLHRKPVRGGADGGLSDTCFREDNYAHLEDRLPGASSPRPGGKQELLRQSLRLDLSGIRPDVCCILGERTEGGFNAERTKSPLPVIESHNLEETEQSILKAGGKITLPIFTFPGGRRFHFTDPAGNELAVMQRD